MLYTGFREIDDKLGGIENGELVVIASDFTAGLHDYILYNLAQQIDEKNRQAIKDYDRKIESILNYEEVDFEKSVEKIVVLGWHNLEFNVLDGFPRGEYETNKFDSFAKKRLLFKELPIEQSISYLYQRSAKSLIKDITHTYKDIKTQISAICVFGWRQKIPMLKEVAQKMNIPVLVLTYIGLSKGIESKIQKYKEQSVYIDKLVIVKNNCWDEKYKDTSNRNTSTFYLENFKTKQSDTIISNYQPSLFFEIYEGDWGECFLPSNRAGIFDAMIQNDEYINKNNFDLYLHLSAEENERFWAYIEVFQRIEANDLYELLKKYKKDVSRRELMLAAEILNKLLIRNTEIETDSSSDFIQF